MELVLKKLGELKPYPNNPRVNEQAVDSVAESIRQCEYIAPIVVDENNVILAGHTRLKALQKLGESECEVVVKSGLTDEQKRKYRLLDNKTGELAEWDFNKLAAEIEGLDFGNLDLDWELNVDELEPTDLEQELDMTDEVLISVKISGIDAWNNIEDDLREIVDRVNGTVAVKMQ